jgi:hypothetical protein
VDGNEGGIAVGFLVAKRRSAYSTRVLNNLNTYLLIFVIKREEKKRVKTSAS